MPEVKNINPKELIDDAARTSGLTPEQVIAEMKKQRAAEKKASAAGKKEAGYGDTTPHTTYPGA